MGKIINAEPADIVVLVMGELVLNKRNSSDMVKDLVLGAISSCINLSLQERTLWQKMVADIVVAPDDRISENEEEMSRMDIKILVIKERLRDIIKNKEETIKTYLERYPWIRNIEFNYKPKAESMIFEV